MSSSILSIPQGDISVVTESLSRFLCKNQVLPPSGTLGGNGPYEPERSAIDHVAQRLSRQFANLDTNLVDRVVWDTYRHFAAHPTREVVPILVQGAARDRLRVMPTGPLPCRRRVLRPHISTADKT